MRKQRKQPPKQQHHQTESTKVCNKYSSYRSPVKVNQSETTLKYFSPLRTHKYHTQTHTPCLMMGEVPLEMSPKNIMIQDMINSENIMNV